MSLRSKHVKDNRFLLLEEWIDNTVIKEGDVVIYNYAVKSTIGTAVELRDIKNKTPSDATE